MGRSYNRRDNATRAAVTAASKEITAKLRATVAAGRAEDECRLAEDARRARIANFESPMWPHRRMFDK